MKAINNSRKRTLFSMNKIAETNSVFKEDKVYLIHRTVQSTSPWKSNLSAYVHNGAILNHISKTSKATNK